MAVTNNGLRGTHGTHNLLHVQYNKYMFSRPIRLTKPCGALAAARDQGPGPRGEVTIATLPITLCPEPNACAGAADDTFQKLSEGGNCTRLLIA